MQQRCASPHSAADTFGGWVQEGKMKELKQQIAGVVDEINEQLEALRYEKADLMECEDAA